MAVAVAESRPLPRVGFRFDLLRPVFFALAALLAVLAV